MSRGAFENTGKDQRLDALKMADSTSTVLSLLHVRKGFCINAFQRVSPDRKETPDGAPLPAPQGANARRLSGPSHPLPRGDRPAGGVRRAVRRLAAEPR